MKKSREGFADSTELKYLEYDTKQKYWSQFFDWGKRDEKYKNDLSDEDKNGLTEFLRQKGQENNNELFNGILEVLDNRFINTSNSYNPYKWKSWKNIQKKETDNLIEETSKYADSNLSDDNTVKSQIEIMKKYIDYLIKSNEDHSWKGDVNSKKIDQIIDYINVNQVNRDSKQDNALLDYAPLKAPLGRVLWVNECEDDGIGQNRCGTNTASGGEVLHQLDGGTLTDEDEAKLLCKQKAYEYNLPYQEVQFSNGSDTGCFKYSAGIHQDTLARAHHPLSMWHLIHDNEKHNLYQDTEFNTYKATQAVTDSKQNTKFNTYKSTQAARDSKQDNALLAHMTSQASRDSEQDKKLLAHMTSQATTDKEQNDNLQSHITNYTARKADVDKTLTKWSNQFSKYVDQEFKVKCYDDSKKGWGVKDENCPEWLKNVSKGK